MGIARSIHVLWNSSLLSAGPVHWIKVFGDMARIHEDTYGIFMHSVRPKRMNLSNAGQSARVAKVLSVNYLSEISLLTSAKQIKFIGWLKEDRADQKNTSV